MDKAIIEVAGVLGLCFVMWLLLYPHKHREK